MKHLANKFLLAALVAFVSASAAQAAAPLRCLTQAEADAMNMRVLQTDLMVSGLSCQLHSDYATFVKAQKKNLAEHGGVMKAYFQRTNGGQKEMDKYVTSLANSASNKSLQMKSKTFCDQARAQFAEVNTLTHEQLLEKLARDANITARVGAPLCTQSAKK